MGVYLITWNTYGTWLPGDARGWTSRKTRDSFAEIRPGNAGLEAAARMSMKGPPVYLSDFQATTVVESIHESCSIKGWTVHAVSVQRDHVHLVVNVGSDEPRKVMSRLKAYATRALRQADRQPGDRYWVRGGHCGYLNTPGAIERAVIYVNNQ